MPFPDEPCPSCPRVARGLPMPCRAMMSRHARFCDFAAEGHRDYVALLCGDMPPPPTERELILARRAAKVRIPLGSRPPQGRR